MVDKMVIIIQTQALITFTMVAFEIIYPTTSRIISKIISRIISKIISKIITKTVVLSIIITMETVLFLILRVMVIAAPQS